MGTKEQDKIISEIRGKTIKIKLSETVSVKDSPGAKVDKKKMWEKAERAGKTISDDNLPAPYTAGA